MSIVMLLAAVMLLVLGTRLSAVDLNYPQAVVHHRQDGNEYVPSGQKIIAEGGGLLQQSMGADNSAYANVAVGMVDSTSNVSGSVQSTEYTLNSLTLPANAFNANTRGVQVTAFGTLAANANAKNLKIYFGATAVASVTGSTASGKDYVIYLTVLRVSSGNQIAMAQIYLDTATAPTTVVVALTETDTAAIVIAVKSANTAAAAASATGKGMMAEFSN